jgi:hypothetical protein
MKASRKRVDPGWFAADLEEPRGIDRASGRVEIHE